MMTETEKRAFRQLCNIIRSFSKQQITFTIDIDNGYVNEGDFDFTPDYFDVYPYSSSNSEIMIPESIKREIQSFYDREGKKILMNGMDKLLDSIPEEANYARAFFQIIAKTYEISLSGYVEYPSDGRSESYEFDLENYSNEIESLKSEYPNLKEFTIDYSGGGDSGWVEDRAYGNDNIVFDAPEVFKEAIYERLPGGWEINEGSSGNGQFNLESMTGVVNHTEYYNEEVSDTFFEETV